MLNACSERWTGSGERPNDYYVSVFAVPMSVTPAFDVDGIVLKGKYLSFYFFQYSQPFDSAFTVGDAVLPGSKIRTTSSAHASSAGTRAAVFVGDRVERHYEEQTKQLRRTLNLSGTELRQPPVRVFKRVSSEVKRSTAQLLGLVSAELYCD